MHDEQPQFNLHPVLDAPLQLIAEAAIGTSSLEEICARYNYTPEQTEQLRNDPTFKVRVSRMEQELLKEGVTTKMRARHVVDDLIGEVYIHAKDPTTSLGMKLEAIKTLTKIADLEPKQVQQQVTGAGYSITINLPQVGELPGRTIEAKAEPVPILSMNDPIFGMDVNRDVSMICEAEPALDKALSDSVNRGVNSTMNSALALPEDWQDE